MRKVILVIIAFILTGSYLLASETRFFPNDILIKNPHSALLRSPSLDALYIFSAMDNKDFMGYNFGTKIPILSLGSKTKYQLGGFGGIFTRFELFTYSFNFVHADFLGGVFCDVKYKRLFIETMLYHVSSHIGDDYVYYKQIVVRDTGYESVKHYTSYRIFPVLDASIGFEYKFSSRPEKYIFYDKSLLMGTRIDLYSEEIPVFLEWEIEITGLKHTPNIGIRAGVYLSYIFNNMILNKDVKGKERHEFSVYYYYGYSKMGYFYDGKESLLLAGPTYRF